MYSIVRDSRRVWPYCTKCGCRLAIRPHESNIRLNYISHFWDDFIWDRDSRGCFCPNLQMAAIITKKKIRDIIGV